MTQTACHLRYVTPDMEHTALVPQSPTAVSLDEARDYLPALRRTFIQRGYDVRPLWTLDEGFEAVRGEARVCVWIQVNVSAVEWHEATA